MEKLGYEYTKQRLAYTRAQKYQSIPFLRIAAMWEEEEKIHLDEWVFELKTKWKPPLMMTAMDLSILLCHQHIQHQAHEASQPSLLSKGVPEDLRYLHLQSKYQANDAAEAH
ncbi:uncharacterized protein LOC132167689 [Corylus avellana]|uniref:uncharacterized protein LOC132167689 n=1 Tax=Corylus avellana TaxID=13451 RepID=UPI00286A31C6|nr:uncharacterized protein LOC132167689 [Corylus avellana]XP_059434682.1 uncharacterized protein LOC132167689 [Corylus avellana]